MEKLRNSDGPFNQGRRDFLKILMPGGWIDDVVRRRPLSPASRKSLVLDMIILTPGLLTAACSPSKPAPTSTPRVTEAPPNMDLGRQKLNTELDNLPDSVIKSLLLARVKPLFGPNPPAIINYDGLDVKLSRPVVRLQTLNANRVSGLFTPRDSSTTTLEPLYPTKETTVRTPYLRLVLDAEKSTIPPSNLGTDGTPLLDIDFPTNTPFYEGLSPVITITTPEPSFIKPVDKKLFENFERFCYVKEACSLLLVDIYIMEAVKKMHKLGLSPTMEAKTSNGTTRQAEALIQSLATINNAQGRISAAIDLAGYLLAFKATEGTDIDDPNNMDRGFASVRPSMQTASLGTSPQDILYNSFRWAITTYSADRQLAHVGNVNNIP